LIAWATAPVTPYTLFARCFGAAERSALRACAG